MSIDPGESTADALELARVYAEARNYRRAAEVLNAALAHDPQNSDLLVQLAQAQLLLGDFKAAEFTSRAALREAPEDTDAMRICAGALGGLNQWQEAVATARSAVEAAPYIPANRYEYARLMVGAGDATGAEPVAAELLTLTPHDAAAHVLMGIILTELKRRREATAEYEEALRLEPGNAAAMHALGYNQAKGWKFTRALGSIREAAQLDPTMGGEARAAITDIIRVWLSWVTVGAWLAVNVATRMEQADDGTGPSPAARMVAGIGAVILLGVCAYVGRALPARSWRSILGPGREFLTLKIYIGLCALVIVALGAFALGAPISAWVLLGVLLVVVIGSWVAPYLDRDRP